MEQDTPSEIHEATRELLLALLEANSLDGFEDIVSAIFTTSPDLTSAFPAEAARSLGMNYVPLLCASEIPVDKSMPRCVRILLHINTDLSQKDVKHIYLRDARRLRPDMTSAQ